MNLPVLAEPIGLPRLPGVAAAVRPVLTLHKRGVHTVARCRLVQQLFQRLWRAEDLTSLHGDDAAILPLLVHRRVDHVVGQSPPGNDAWPARLAWHRRR